jgi:hypothetical protein
VGVEADATYDEITALCFSLDAGAPAVPTVAAFVDERSTPATTVPMAKVTATGLGLQCPDHYATTMEAARMLAPELELPEVPSFEWLP